MLETYKEQLETKIKSEDDKEIRETLVYYIGFIDGLLSVDIEPDDEFIQLIETILKD